MFIPRHCIKTWRYSSFILILSVEMGGGGKVTYLPTLSHQNKELFDRDGHWALQP